MEDGEESPRRGGDLFTAQNFIWDQSLYYIRGLGRQYAAMSVCGPCPMYHRRNNSRGVTPHNSVQRARGKKNSAHANTQQGTDDRYRLAWLSYPSVDEGSI